MLKLLGQLVGGTTGLIVDGAKAGINFMKDTPEEFSEGFKAGFKHGIFGANDDANKAPADKTEQPQREFQDEEPKENKGSQS